MNLKRAWEDAIGVIFIMIIIYTIYIIYGIYLSELIAIYLAFMIIKYGILIKQGKDMNKKRKV
jgi:hypothetical protein